jgi:DNA-damage-inducible protein J
MNAATVKAKVSPALKAESEGVLKQLGLDMSVAIKMFLNQVVMHRGLPFEVRVANVVTAKAIEDSYAGRVETATSVDALIAEATR